VACVKVEARLGDILPRLANALIPPTVAAATRKARVSTLA
jgi:hypothetical protein